VTDRIGSKYARVSGNFKALPRTPKRALDAAFYSRGHRHGCERCNLLIPLCSCAAPEHDPLCALCLYGRNPPWTSITRGLMPCDCCRAHALPASDHTKVRFLLAGTRPWYACPVCHRKHPFDPRDPSNDPPLNTEQWQERFGELPTPDYRRPRW
jgi:hypothetical protein